MSAAPLFLHIVALTVLVAGGVGGLLVHRVLVATIRSSPQQAAPLGLLAGRCGITAQIGALLMLLSGLYLMASRGWADWGTTWLSIKLTIYVLLVANGFLLAKPTGAKLGAELSRGPAADTGVVSKLIGRLDMFYVLQLIGLVAIFALATFGPRAG